MRRNTRQEILQTAKELFNQQGFREVSVRDIADAMGISKGNLTYHFKRKEDILEAIITETPNAQPPRVPQSLEETHAFFLHIHSVLRENAFYFRHHTQLSALSPKVYKLQRESFGMNVDKLHSAFVLLNGSGLLREELYAGEYTRIIETIFLSCIYWLPFCNLKGDISPEGFPLHAWALTCPLLTDKGRQTLAAIVTL